MTESISVDDFRAKARSWLAENMPRRGEGGGVRLGARGGGVEDSPEHRAEMKAQQKALFDAGFQGITWPAEYGGQGLTSAHQQAFNEEAAGYAMPPPPGGVGLGIVGPTLLQYATEEQKREWIALMLSGQEDWVQFLSEPSAGSDLAGVLTRAVRDGDEWVLTGSKIWSTGAQHCQAAMCLARTDWDVPKHKGLTWFKVPIPSPGLTVRPIREINGGAEFCEEFLDEVRVPHANVIGEVNGGWPIANTLLAFERGAGRSNDLPAAAPAGAEGMPDAIGGGRRLAPDLVAVARKSGVLETGAARQAIARAHVNGYMHGQMSRRVGQAMVLGKVNSSAASMIKLGTGIINPIRAMIEMELAGAQGVAWHADDQQGNQPSTTYVNGRIMSIAGGSNQVQRNIVSERLLGLPREPSFDSDKPFNEVLRDAKNWTGAR